MSNALRIALLTDGMYPYVIGGMQKHSYFLAKYMAARGVQVELWHCVPEGKELVTDPEGFTAEELKNIRHRCLHFPAPGKLPGHYIRNSYKYSCDLFNDFLKCGADVDFIYAKGFSGWRFIEEKKRGMKLPPIGVNFHGYEMFQKPPSFKTLLSFIFLLRGPVKRLTRDADYVFSYGGQVTSIISNLGVPDRRIIEIPSGMGSPWIDLPLPVKLSSPGVRQFAFIGRYERRKGIEELTSVLEDLLPVQNLIFHFIGPIPEDKKIISDKVKYWGSVTGAENIAAILQKADVLVCPSFSEGMPTVIMEGMAAGLAVIATDVGAVSLLAGPGTGWLLPPGDKAALRQAVLEAISIDDSKLLELKQRAARKIREGFTWDRIADLTIDAIKSRI
jgi:glycosyltransferase involved in cell wall biosynthesis